jgi:phosphatidate cytidylyltransferase
MIDAPKTVAKKSAERSNSSASRPALAWIDGPRRAVGDCETARTLAVALVLALAGAGCAPVAMLPYRDTQPPTVSLPLALAGIVALSGVWVALVELQARSPWLVLAAMAIVWIADTAAYFAGRAFGRRKLAPLVSPGKTWEGVFGALAAVAVYAAAIAPFAHSAGYQGRGDAVALIAWIALALALALMSVLGDLYESWLKRQAGVKDSGTLLPGHGGILDRVDALLAAMPPAALAAHRFLGT